MADAAPVRVVLVGKADCHLCDAARDVVAAVCGELGVPWEERSLADDPAFADQFWELIPVVLVDGLRHDYWRIDPVRLREALRAPVELDLSDPASQGE